MPAIKLWDVRPLLRPRLAEPRLDESVVDGGRLMLDDGHLRWQPAAGAAADPVGGVDAEQVDDDGLPVDGRG
jgi:hypothetical protein